MTKKRIEQAKRSISKLQKKIESGKYNSMDIQSLHYEQGVLAYSKEMMKK